MLWLKSAILGCVSTWPMKWNTFSGGGAYFLDDSHGRHECSPLQEFRQHAVGQKRSFSDKRSRPFSLATRPEFSSSSKYFPNASFGSAPHSCAIRFSETPSFMRSPSIRDSPDRFFGVIHALGAGGGVARVLRVDVGSGVVPQALPLDEGMRSCAEAQIIPAASNSGCAYTRSRVLRKLLIS